MNSSQLEHNANKLIALKNTIERLKQEEKELKNQLAPYIQTDEQLVLATGLLYIYTDKVSRSFNRKEVLAFVKEHYGKKVSNDIDTHCTIKKITPQRLHVRMNKDQTD